MCAVVLHAYLVIVHWLGGFSRKFTLLAIKHIASYSYC